MDNQNLLKELQNNATKAREIQSRQHDIARHLEKYRLVISEINYRIERDVASERNEFGKLKYSNQRIRDSEARHRLVNNCEYRAVKEKMEPLQIKKN